MPTPIARTWCGTTRAADGDSYLAYLLATGLAAYRATPGNRGVFALRRLECGRAEWLLITLWESVDAVRAFVGAAGGADATGAVFYPEDARFLTARDERATHYDVVYAAPLPAEAGADASRLGGRGTGRGDTP